MKDITFSFPIPLSLNEGSAVEEGGGGGVGWGQNWGAREDEKISSPGASCSKSEQL